MRDARENQLTKQCQIDVCLNCTFFYHGRHKYQRTTFTVSLIQAPIRTIETFRQSKIVKPSRRIRPKQLQNVRGLSKLILSLGWMASHASGRWPKNFPCDTYSFSIFNNNVTQKLEKERRQRPSNSCWITKFRLLRPEEHHMP